MAISDGSRLSSHLGIPATIRPKVMAASTKLPSVLEQLHRVSCHSYQIGQIFGDCDDISTGLLPNAMSVIPNIESQLNLLDRDLGDGSHPVVGIALLRTKLQLGSFVFSSAGLSAAANLEVAVLLARASTAAIGLIHAASTQIPPKSWPSMVKMSVFLAANFLLFLSILPGYENQLVVRNAINESWRVLQSQSEYENDSYSRLSQIILYLGQIYSERGRSHQSVPGVKSRMSANIAWENVWRARARFSERLRGSRPSDYTLAAALDAASLDLQDLSFDPQFLHGFDAEEASHWFADI